MRCYISSLHKTEMNLSFYISAMISGMLGPNLQKVFFFFSSYRHLFVLVECRLVLVRAVFQVLSSKLCKTLVLFWELGLVCRLRMANERIRVGFYFGTKRDCNGACYSGSFGILLQSSSSL
eukprot:TRINITY_DN34062_c0_g1_i1.p1 TRINITY_DN34062_c0_g1~~TRINITY_DN34062_c0_g1_i1.p1  ORF type:complete len:121 (+),score=1.61 TRINITY_DN34062_c0_g1_i1:50-412(+)